MTTALQHHDGEFTERNLLLHLALGLRARGAQVERLVARFAPECANPEVVADAHPDPRDLALAHCVLGILAFHRRLEALLSEASATTSSPAPEARHPRRFPKELAR